MHHMVFFGGGSDSYEQMMLMGGAGQQGYGGIPSWMGGGAGGFSDIGSWYANWNAYINGGLFRHQGLECLQ